MEEAADEMLLMGLRLREGVPSERYRADERARYFAGPAGVPARARVDRIGGRRAAQDHARRLAGARFGGRGPRGLNMARHSGTMIVRLS